MSRIKANVPLFDESVGLDADGAMTFGRMVLGASVLIGAFVGGQWLLNRMGQATGVTADAVEVI